MERRLFFTEIQVVQEETRRYLVFCFSKTISVYVLLGEEKRMVNQ